MKKEHFRELSLWKKFLYIGDNVFWDILLAAALMTTFISWIKTDFIDPKPVLSIEMIDGTKLESQSDAFDEFLSQEGFTDEEHMVKLNQRIQIGDSPTNMKCNADLMIVAIMLSQRTDIYFWDTQSTDTSLMNFDLVDLRTILPHEVLAANEDRLVYNVPAIEGGFPCAIDLTDSSWVAENGFYDRCVVGISKHAKDAETAGEFIEYLI